MRLRMTIVFPGLSGFPRVSGDAPHGSSISDATARFSPRERGCALSGCLFRLGCNVFPA